MKKAIKKQFKQAKKHLKIAIPAVLVLILLIGVLTALVVTGGDDGDDSTATTATDKKGKKKNPRVKAAKKRKVKPAPVISGSGTLDVARKEGRLALAQARGRIKHPGGVQVRVSAAPKQMVTVDWQLACFKANGLSHSTKIDQGRYRTRPPAIRRLPLPMSGADECTATVGAQLTRGVGRIKVAVLGG